MTENQKVEILAKAMAGCYWRGRLEPLSRSGDEMELKAMMKAASESNWAMWGTVAKNLLNTIEEP